MGTQTKRQQDWEKTRKRKSATSGLNKYNPTQPSQFTKIISSQQHKVNCLRRKVYKMQEENNKPEYAIVGDHTPIMLKAVSQAIESIKNRQSVSIK